MKPLFDKETTAAIQQLCDETCEAMQLAKKGPDDDDVDAERLGHRGVGVPPVPEVAEPAVLEPVHVHGVVQVSVRIQLVRARLDFDDGRFRHVAGIVRPSPAPLPLPFKRWRAGPDGSIFTPLGPDHQLLGWTIKDSLDHYNVPLWSAGFFGVNEAGHVVARPRREGQGEIDLKELVEDLRARGYELRRGAAESALTPLSAG